MRDVVAHFLSKVEDAWCGWCQWMMMMMLCQRSDVAVFSTHFQNCIDDEHPRDELTAFHSRVKIYSSSLYVSTSVQ
jgi:hypothetical protein